MQISETTMSKTREASRRLASSPLDASSTLCPSLRKLISSSSQMERSSSTTRRWAIGLPLPCRRQQFGARLQALAPGRRSRTNGSRQLHDEIGAASLLRFHANAALVRLKNLVNNLHA